MIAPIQLDVKEFVGGKSLTKGNFGTMIKEKA
jgi:hypothetical protein